MLSLLLKFEWNCAKVGQGQITTRENFFSKICLFQALKAKLT
jgi:hypothetical protein